MLRAGSAAVAVSTAVSLSLFLTHTLYLILSHTLSHSHTLSRTHAHTLSLPGDEEPSRDRPVGHHLSPFLTLSLFDGEGGDRLIEVLPADRAAVAVGARVAWFQRFRV